MDRRQFHRCMLTLVGLATPLGRGAGAAETAALEIPANTWVARPLPGPGKAPFKAAKDFRMAFHPGEGVFYLAHGDWSGPWGENSGRQEMYSYDVGRDHWELVQPYCLGEGKIQPAGPDELGWVFDSRRQVFWMIPGYQWQNACPSAVHGKLMTFDPRTREWQIVEGIDPIRTDVLYSHYDARDDVILTMVWDGGTGAAMDILDCEARTMRRIRFRGEAQEARLAKEYSAMDPKARIIYAIDGLRGELYAYDMDRQTLSRRGPAPHRPGRQNSVVLAWDTGNEVLLWPFRDTVHIYDPNTDRWRSEQPPQPEGIEVRGNSAAFDPLHGAMIYMGRMERMEHLFLYRYAP